MVERTIYEIAQNGSKELRVLVHVADSERPSDFELFRSLILAGDLARLCAEAMFDVWLTGLCDLPGRGFAAVGMTGAFKYNVGDGWVDQMFDQSWSFNTIRRFTTTLIAVGLEGMILTGSVRELTRVAHPGNKDLLDVAGRNVDDVYVIGEGGRLHWYDGRRLKRLASPTNVEFRSIAAGPDGTVAIGGDAGFLMTGAGDRWDIHEGLDGDIYGLAWSDGHWHVAAGEDGLFILDKTGYRRIDDQPIDVLRQVGDRLFGWIEATLWIRQDMRWKAVPIEWPDEA